MKLRYFTRSRNLLVFLAIITFPVTGPQSLGAQEEITLDTIGSTKVRDEEIEVEASEDLSGTLRFDRQATTGLIVQVAFRRENSEDWRIGIPEIHLDPSGAAVRWRLEGVAIGDPRAARDCGARFEVVALATMRSLAAGQLDEARLYTTATISPRSRVRRSLCEIVPPEDPSPRIKIDYIGGKPVQPESILEVRLQEALSGEVVLPFGSVVRVVVQPISSTGRWVMEVDPQVSGRRWTGLALFGREGLDEWTDFVVYAVVTDPRLHSGQEIHPNEWYAINQQGLIVARSPEVLVRRVELPPVEGVGLRIHAIEHTAVDDKATWPVDRKSGITGLVTGRSLSTTDGVWVLVTASFGDDSWELLGKASMIDRRYWQMPPRVLGEPGQFHDLVAVLSGGPIESLSNDEIRENMPMSERVHIVIKDRPPLQILIGAVDRQVVGGREEFRVSSLSSLEGSVTGRPIDQTEKIRIFKTNAGEEGDWELLTPAPMINKQSWAVPPIRLGRPGDRLILLAVVVGEEIEQIGPEILAFSDKVHVQLQ